MTPRLVLVPALIALSACNGLSSKQCDFAQIALKEFREKYRIGQFDYSSEMRSFNNSVFFMIRYRNSAHSGAYLVEIDRAKCSVLGSGLQE